MSSERNIAMSLRYYIAKHLRAYNGKYDVRMAIEEDAWERPCGVVMPSGPTQATSPHFRIAENNRPFSIYVYPEQGGSPKLAVMEALRVEAVIKAAFQKGGQGGRPMRIPVFDFSAIADEGESILEDDGEGGEKEPDVYQYVRVMDASVDHKADPDDETLQTVFGNFRVKWRDKGEEYPNSPKLEEISVVKRVGV